MSFIFHLFRFVTSLIFLIYLINIHEIEKLILEDEIDDPEFLEFAIENYSEMFEYIATGRVNIRIHRDIEGKMWFGCELNCELNYQNRGLITLPFPLFIFLSQGL